MALVGIGQPLRVQWYTHSVRVLQVDRLLVVHARVTAGVFAPRAGEAHLNQSGRYDLALIADMNSQRLAFTAFDGDLKAGSNSPCNDALYTGAKAYFDALKTPAVFTPGDNDWTDCDRPSNGGFNSLERLDHERQVFFSTPFSQGQHKIRQQVQTDLLCLGVSGLVPCVENRRWSIGGVTYATLNIQGSCNNLCDTDPSVPEFEARNHANIVWMQDTFAEARRRHSAAVMLISQGNPGWDLNDG